MRVLVLGAGAVGSYYGGRLAQSGHEVVFIGRPRHVQAIRERGLILDSTKTGRHVISIEAAEAVFPTKPFDLVLLCVKSYDTESAATSLRETLGPGTVVLCLQNGIDNHEIAGRILGAHRVYPTVVYVGVRIPEAGVVEHVGRGEIILPESLSTLVPVFEKAGIPATTTDNIVGMVWNKLLLNASCNVLGMISGASFGELSQQPEAREVIRGSVEEILRLAEARGIRIPGESHGEQVLKTAEGLGPGLSSMLQDYRAGKRIEIDAINGVVVNMGKQFGIPTPFNMTLFAAGKLMQAQLKKREAR
jgi:2-dehydropantoate 2-reductase